MAFASIQNGFSSGEMSPRLFGRTDLSKYHLGCSTLRNMFVDYRGGADSRAGLAFVGMCKQGAPNSGGTATDDPPRDIPFQFSISQGYALEFGDQYMRIKSNGAYVVESTTSISGATSASPMVITDTGHGYSNGDWVFITGMPGLLENTIYATGFNASALTIIDDSSILSAPTGAGSEGVCISPDGTKAYVANSTDNTVSVIDIATRTLVATVTVGTSPRGVAITPDGTQVFVSNFSSNNVSVISTVSNTVTHTIAMGASTNPSSVAIMPNGVSAYVTNFGNNTVNPITISTYAVGAAINVGVGPRCVSITHNNAFAYVSNQGGTVSVITIASNTVTATVNVGNGSEGIVVTPDSQFAYVANYDDGTVSVITIASNTVLTTINVNPHPIGIAVSSDSAHIYVNSETNSTISTIAVASNTVTSTIPTGSTPFGPQSLAVYSASTTQGGFASLNGLTWIVTNKTANTFRLTDLFGNTVDSSAFGTYTSGGTAARIYTVVAPYAAVDLPFLKFTQSADTMTLTCVNQETDVEYPSYELVRNGATDWTFTADSFASAIAAPAGISVVANNSTTPSTFYSYVVTAVDATTGEESIASSVGTVENNDIAINAGSNVITWNPVTNASSYNVYTATPSYAVAVPTGASFGFIGTAFGTQFTDTNIIADFTVVPPVHNDPFARGKILGVTPTAVGSSYTQSGIGYSITSSLGSGAVIVPIVVNGGAVAYIVQNGGENYLPTDTITITGSGTGGTQATGSYDFTFSTISNGNTIVLNGVTWTFVTSGAVGHQTVIQGTIKATLQQLATDLILRGNASITVASYAESGNFTFNIIYNTAGTVGNAYTLGAGTVPGVILSGSTLTGGTNGGADGATANLVVGPNMGTYPAVCAYYQQRRVYAFTLNNPDTYFMSQPGAFANMDSSIPTTDSDSITGAPWAQQINGIQFLVPMPGGLVILTGKGAWTLNGGTNAAITPVDQTATPQAYNGCHFHIPPIVVNYDILYVQAKGSIVRDLSYNFFVNIYTGTDMTVLSEHLFNFHQLQQWAYAEEPFKIIWAVRDDGILLSLTYLKEQDVYGWARHDTNGLFVGVCSITEPPVDAVYVITKRYIPGSASIPAGVWAYYSERMDNRNWQDIEDCFCVDAGLSLPMTFPDATLTPAAADGTNNISSTDIATGGTGYTSPTATAVDATGAGTGASFTVTVVAGVITAVTPVTQGTDYTAGETTIVITDSTGSGAVVYPVITNIVNFSTDSSVFTPSMVGDVIRIGNNNASPSSGFTIAPNGGGKAVITSVFSSTNIAANIIEPITNIVTNDPNDTPIPVSPNYWTVSTPVTSISGLNHLEGMEVACLADGSVVDGLTVNDGTVTLTDAASQIVIGLPFTAQLQSLFLDPPSPTTVQGKRKLINAVTCRVEKSRGIFVGVNQPDASTQPDGVAPEWTNMTPMKQRNATQPMGSAIPLATGDLRELVIGDWAKPAQIAVQVTDPVPCNLLALIPEWVIGDNNG